jgi:hypothetical protein
MNLDYFCFSTWRFLVSWIFISWSKKQNETKQKTNYNKNNTNQTAVVSDIKPSLTLEGRDLATSVFLYHNHKSFPGNAQETFIYISLFKTVPQSDTSDLCL